MLARIIKIHKVHLAKKGEYKEIVDLLNLSLLNTVYPRAAVVAVGA